MRLQTATRIDLAAWYEHVVGYSPIGDDPTMSTDDLRDLCLSYAFERYEDLASQEPEDSRDWPDYGEFESLHIVLNQE